MTKILLSIILSLATTSALAADDCYLHETNPVTKKVFASQAEYNSAVLEWKYREPQSPGLVALARAYAVYSKERAVAEKMTRDKRAHCYMGCRISQDLDYRTAEYVAWYKEEKDIKDCKKGTHFEHADFDATVEGAQMGQSQVDAAGCMQACTQKY